MSPTDEILRSTLRFNSVELPKTHSTDSRMGGLCLKIVANNEYFCYNCPMSDKKVPTVGLEKLKSNIAANLVAFRKEAGLTQQELAEKLNYSDKNISKWERGEGIPDVLALATMAEIYGVTVNDFLKEHKKSPRTKSLLKNLIAKRWLVTLLSFGLVWLVATIVTVVCGLVNSNIPMAFYAYLSALPVSLIVVLVFSCVWGNLWQRCVVVSLLCWSLCLLAFLLISAANSWLTFLVGAVLQLLVILWYLLRFFVLKDKKRKEATREQE